MVSGINNIVQSVFQPQISSQGQLSTVNTADSTSYEPLNSFADEDTAIISSQAKLLNELDKFNSGGDNDVDLAVAGVLAKNTVSAEVNVINTKKDMIDTVLNMAK